MTEEQRFEESLKLREAALPLIKYLNENYHPHCIAIVKLDGVEILEGVKCLNDINDINN